jgi:hypothetical protein
MLARRVRAKKIRAHFEWNFGLLFMKQSSITGTTEASLRKVTSVYNFLG